jgi:hypothetical protein
MTIEKAVEMINLPSSEEDRKYVFSKIESNFNLEMEIDSAKDAQKNNIDDVYEFYKNKISEDVKKGDVSAMIKAFVAESKEGKISADVEKKEHFLSLLDIAKKDLKI